MDLSHTDTVVSVLAGILIVVGIFGVLLPTVPGLVLSWFGVLVWAIYHSGGAVTWVVAGVATLFAAGGTAVKYIWPHRNLRRTGVPTWSIVIGGLLGIVGFFVIPVIGLPIGFVLGILIAERARQGSNRVAWQSTKAALGAVGLAIMVELFAGFLVAATWVIGLVAA